MPTIITADSGHDFLALLPHLLGYHPRESVVLVAFRGKRTCGALRFDLPPELSLREQRRTATAMIGTLCKIAGVDGVVPVAFTESEFSAGTDIPHAVFLDVLVHRAEVAGLRVRDALCRASDGWASYLDPASPPGGRPLSEIDDSDVHQMAGDDASLREGAAAGTEPPAVDPAAAERVARRMQLVNPVGVTRRGLAAASEEDLTPLLDLADDVVLRADALTDDEAARLLASVQSPALRDVVLLLWAFGRETGRRTAVEAIAYARTGDLIESPDALLLWGAGPRPDPERIENAIALLLRLVALAPVHARPAPYSMLAWLCWALGQSSRAAVFVDEAEMVDPEYGLAGLIGAMITGGRLPDWAFDVPEVDESTVRYATRPVRST